MEASQTPEENRWAFLYPDPHPEESRFFPVLWNDLQAMLHRKVMGSREGGAFASSLCREQRAGD
jgi:hypothetical protein